MTMWILDLGGLKIPPALRIFGGPKRMASIVLKICPPIEFTLII